MAYSFFGGGLSSKAPHVKMSGCSFLMCISAKCYNKVTFMRVQPGMPSADAHPSGRDGLRLALFCYYPERRKAAGTWALKRLESVTTTGLADNAVIHGLFAFASRPCECEAGAS